MFAGSKKYGLFHIKLSEPVKFEVSEEQSSMADFSRENTSHWRKCSNQSQIVNVKASEIVHNWGKSSKTCASCEDRTHDLQIALALADYETDALPTAPTGHLSLFTVVRLSKLPSQCPL